MLKPFLLRFYRPYLREYSAALFFFVVKTAYLWLSPILIARAIDANNLTGEEQMSELFFCGGILLLSVVLNIPSTLLQVYYQSRATRSGSLAMRQALCETIQRLSLGYHLRNAVGRIQARVIRDIDLLEQIPPQVLNVVVMAVLTLGAAVIAIGRTSPVALLLFLVILPLCTFVRYFLRRSMQFASERYREYFDAMSVSVSDMLRMVPVTRAHGLEPEEMEKVQGRLHTLRDSAFRLDFISAGFGIANWVLLTLVQLAFLLGAIYASFRQWISIGEVVMFNAYFASLSGSVMGVLNLMPTLVQGRTSAMAIQSLLSEDEIEHHGHLTLPQLKGEFRLSQIGYRYAQQNADALKGVDLRIHPGTCLGIAGPSGCGKSTLLSLLLGFRHPSNGRLLIDGTDLRDLDMRQIRRQVGIVTQETHFFSGSIRENLTLGLGAISDERLRKALADADALTFVQDLPEGWESRIGDGGLGFSGGQQQRLALARALVREPKILVLDEATSALDPESEARIMEVFSRVSRGRTTIIVAHRLTTLLSCDEIILMDSGGVVGRGSPDGLLAGDNYFSRNLKGGRFAG